MEKITVYSFKGLYRDDFRITGYRFGSGKKALAVVGETRGNEFQQLFACSRLVKCFKELEAADLLPPDREILVIPSCNPYSINIRKRFWPTDNTDINRMFPGYSLGETTQRIAEGIFDAIKDFENGIQFTSFYMSGNFAPHVRVMHTGFENVELAKKFGLPYVIIRRPRPYDTTTLNYNWQIWETNAFSLYTNDTEHTCAETADESVLAIVRFMKAAGIAAEADVSDEARNVLTDLGKKAADIITGSDRAENGSSDIIVIDDEQMDFVRSGAAGFFIGFVSPGERVKKGQLLAEIYDCLDGEKLEDVISPDDGIIHFAHNEDMTYEATTLFKIIVDA